MKHWKLVIVLVSISALSTSAFANKERIWRELDKKEKQQRLESIPKTAFLYQDIYKSVNPAVVNISTFQFVGDKSIKTENGVHQRKNLGTGIFISKRGLILTNYHVVKYEQGIAVIDYQDQIYRALVVGSDEITDVALLEVKEEKTFSTVPFGDSDAIEVGQWVLAIGNPFGFRNTLTHGIVSGIGRIISADTTQKRLDDFIQVDASINPGNSGGPLINLFGELIGINTAVTAKGSGVAFAVPINKIKTVVSELINFGRVRRGWLGFVLRNPSDAERQRLKMQTADGAVILKCVPGSPAEEAGLRSGDVLLSVDGDVITSLNLLSRTILETTPDSKLTFVIDRKGVRKQVSVTVGELKQN